MSDTFEKTVDPSVEHIDLADLADLEVIGGVVNQQDHEETVFQALRKHPRTLLWCVYALWVLTLSSYDNQAGGIFLGIPQFRKDFGFPYNGNYVLYANWQSAYSGGPTASSVISPSSDIEILSLIDCRIGLSWELSARAIWQTKLAGSLSTLSPSRLC
jgi:hypothetical protein